MTFREKLKALCGYTDLDDYEGAYHSLIDYIGIDKLRDCIPLSDEELKRAYQKDRHFNSISIRRWDAWTGNYSYRTKDDTEDYRRCDSSIKRLMNNAGINIFSVSECVSLLKNTARIWVESQMAATK